MRRCELVELVSGRDQLQPLADAHAMTKNVLASSTAPRHRPLVTMRAGAVLPFLWRQDAEGIAAA